MIKRIKMLVIVDADGEFHEYEVTVPHGLDQSTYQTLAEGVAFQRDWTKENGLCVGFAIYNENEDQSSDSRMYMVIHDSYYGRMTMRIDDSGDLYFETENDGDYMVVSEAVPSLLRLLDSNRSRYDKK